VRIHAPDSSSGDSSSGGAARHVDLPPRPHLRRRDFRTVYEAEGIQCLFNEAGRAFLRAEGGIQDASRRHSLAAASGRGASVQGGGRGDAGGSAGESSDRGGTPSPTLSAPFGPSPAGGPSAPSRGPFQAAPDVPPRLPLAGPAGGPSAPSRGPSQAAPDVPPRLPPADSSRPPLASISVNSQTSGRGTKRTGDPLPPVHRTGRGRISREPWWASGGDYEVT